MSETPNDKWEPCGPCGGLGRMMRMEDRALVTCGYCDGAMRRVVTHTLQDKPIDSTVKPSAWD